jgi:hypothetical protein
MTGFETDRVMTKSSTAVKKTKKLNVNSKTAKKTPISTARMTAQTTQKNSRLPSFDRNMPA